MKLLIGCINFNTKVFTEIWLRSLTSSLQSYLDTTMYSPSIFKIVIINNSPEESLEDLKKKFPQGNITWIENKENIGVSAGWNQIIKEGFDGNGNALFDYYIPANNDILFTKDWAYNFIEGLQQDTKKEFYWVSSMMNDYKEPELTGIEETLQLEGRYWGGLRPEADSVESVEQIESITKTVYAPFGGIDKFASLLKQKYGNRLREMHPKAPLFALSKECLAKVGLFDEYNSPNGLHEDADYCLRVKLADGKIGFITGAFCQHYSMMSRTKGEFKKEWWVESREKAFQEKWGVSSKEMHKITKDKKFKLDLGSGYGPRKDGHWYHMEIDPKFPSIEFLGDISKDLPFDDESMSEIYASNCLEHCEWKTILGVLYEWRRVLATGGKIEIRVPNFRFAAERYLEGSWKLSLIEGTERNLTHLIFGGDNPGYPHLHKVGLDFDNLSQALKDVGFINVVNASDNGSWELKVIAEK